MLKKLSLYISLVMLLSTMAFTQSANLKAVSLQLEWKHQFEFAGFYAAKEQGYYADVGLEVDIKEYRSGIDIMDDVLKGKTTYALSSSQLIMERLSGKPVVLLASYLKQNALVFLTKPEITSVSQFKNKKIMATENELKMTSLAVQLAENNIKLDDFERIPHSFSIDEFVNGEVDVMTAFISNQPFLLKEANKAFNIINPLDQGIYAYDIELFTSEYEAIKNVKQTQDFIDASNKGWAYALSHQEVLVELIYTQYSKEKSKAALLFEAKKIASLMKTNIYQIGAVATELIALNTNMYVKLGMVDKHWKLDGFLFNEEAKEVRYTQDELDFIKAHPVIRFSDVQWEPFAKISKHRDTEEYSGIFKEYYDLLSERTGLTFEFVPIESNINFQLVLDALKSKKIDMIDGTGRTKERESYALFSGPIMKVSLGIVSANTDSIQTLKELEGKFVAVAKGSTASEYLKENFPNIQCIYVKNVDDALEMVVQKKALATVDNMVVLDTSLTKKNLYSKLDIYEAESYQFDIYGLIRDDYPILHQIMNKAIKSITKKELMTINNKLVLTRVKNTSSSSILREEAYSAYLLSLVWKILLPIGVILLFLLLRQYFLTQYNKKLQKKVDKTLNELREKDKLLLKKYRMAAMGEMLSMIAHQWRQPLSGISIVLSSVETKILSKKFDFDKLEEREKFITFLRQKHSNISQYISYLASTTDDFRNFFNPSKSVELVAITLPIENALELVLVAMQSHGIEVVKKYRTAYKLELYKNEMMQVFLILFKNCEDNFIKRKITNPQIVIETLESKDNIIIKVQDNGQGIDTNIIEKIFDPYFSTRDEQNGTGLGLYMSKIIIENNHNASLKVYNTKDGVTFEIMFLK